MKKFFDFRENRYNIRKSQEMRQQKVRTVRYGLKTALYRAPQLWSLVLTDLNSVPNVNHFKSKIKHWKCTECPCKLCKTYLTNMGYYNVSSKSIKPSNKVRRISQHFHLQVFLYQTFSYIVFQNIMSAFGTAHKTSETELLQK